MGLHNKIIWLAVTMTADELASSQFNLIQVYFIPKTRGGPDRDQAGGQRILQRTLFQNFVL